MSGKKHYQQGESGSSFTYPMQVANVKQNDYAILKGFPCLVTEITTGKGGKCGHIKAYIIGIDIFTGKKYEELCPILHNIEIPFVKKYELQLIGISDDDYLTLLIENGEIKEDIKLPDDEPQLVEKLKADFDNQKDIIVSIIQAMGQEKVISYREIVN
ncbi:eukaryotic translation initiation factor 5A (macronuclear) [Tetrahymena thermophila SB210]|uniref:Eukaryotic translation initiation factor 5A n=1 Tax=Tetrahymena thermophila (strain SB210) TaxID=312017 RepID=Q249Q0_TETTS|nr:eukaryotic translation initiation factor 5A [Tetrahymena thermophila SB210]EAS04503.1 eukaryotic translation initiation factor 5A [Tetrahymena thermophila SB210]|eukprot:XP_001024748.1 eukaryotic translation initiation factor 5A [Tetrahymena thermophila SB210]